MFNLFSPVHLFGSDNIYFKFFFNATQYIVQKSQNHKLPSDFQNALSNSNWSGIANWISVTTIPNCPIHKITKNWFVGIRIRYYIRTCTHSFNDAILVKLSINLFLAPLQQDISPNAHFVFHFDYTATLRVIYKVRR